jgi:hypothetical protein
MNVIHPPYVFILPEARRKLDAYIQLCKLEISGLGTVTQYGNNFLIEDIFLFKQQASIGETNLDGAAIANFLIQLIEEGIDPNKVKLWWHSHANNHCFWSDIDDSTIDLFNNGWMISIVGNHMDTYLTRVDLYEPIRVGINEVKLKTYLELGDEFKKGIQAEIQTKVIPKKYPKIVELCPICQDVLSKGWCRTCLQIVPKKERLKGNDNDIGFTNVINVV